MCNSDTSNKRYIGEKMLFRMTTQPGIWGQNKSNFEAQH